MSLSLTSVVSYLSCLLESHSPRPICLPPAIHSFHKEFRPSSILTILQLLTAPLWRARLLVKMASASRSSPIEPHPDPLSRTLDVLPPSSDPQAGIHYQTRLAKVKRFHSARQEISYDTAGQLPTSDSMLRNLVMDRIKARLTRFGFSAENLGERFLAWLLPKNGADKQQWCTLLGSSFLVSNLQLQSMLSLEQSTASTPLDPDKKAIFYLRTLPMTLTMLLEVLQHLLDFGNTHDNIMSLLDMIRPYKGPNLPNFPVFVRYIGVTKQGKAWIRQSQDMAKSSSQSFVVLFLQAVSELYPEVIDAVEVHEIQDATMFFPAEQSLIDIREQALISLFNLDFLLNTQPGGHRAVYHPEPTDLYQFTGLLTNLLERLQHQCHPCTPQVKEGVDAYARAVQKYCLENPFSTGSNRTAFTDEIRDLISMQARPSQTDRGHTIMVTIGSDIPPEAARSLSRFYGGGVTSGDLCVEILNQLGSWETGAHLTRKDIVTGLLQNDSLPFVDLYPWFRKDRNELHIALRLLRGYLQLTKPLIVLTFSHKVSSAALGNFQHDMGLKRAQYSESIGKPFLSKYDEDPSVSDDENCCIVIPCYHPGRGRCGGDPSNIFPQLMAKVYSTCWFLMTKAIEFEVSTELTTKRAICDRLCQAWSETIGPETAFGKSLSHIQARLLKSWSEKVARWRNFASLMKCSKYEGDVDHKSRGFEISYRDSQLQIQTSSIRWQRAEEELLVLINCGRAKGEWYGPSGQERRRQVALISGLSIAYLKGTKSDKGLKRLLSDVPEGKLYYHELTDVTERLEDIPNLLSLFLDRATNPNRSGWEQDKAIVTKADSSLFEWIQTSILDTKKFLHTPEELSEHGRSALRQLLYTKDPALARQVRTEARQVDLVLRDPNESLDGKRVSIFAECVSRREAVLDLRCLFVKNKNDDVVKFFVPWACTPLHTNDHRFIFFIAEGIDIRNARGESLGTPPHRPCTLPLSTLVVQLKKNPLGEELLALWERETGLKVDQALFSSANSTEKMIPKDFFTGRAEALLTPTRISNANREKALRDLIPYQPGDAMWLLDRFFSDQYPELDSSTGTVDLGNPENWPESPTVWVKLETWLDKRLYYHHPHRISLKAMATTARDIKQGKFMGQAMRAAVQIFFKDVHAKAVRSDINYKSRGKTVLQVSGGRNDNVVSRPSEPAPVVWQPAPEDLLEDVEEEVVAESSVRPGGWLDEEPDEMLLDQFEQQQAPYNSDPAESGDAIYALFGLKPSGTGQLLKRPWEDEGTDIEDGGKGKGKGKQVKRD
jgi:hypothetical protein